MPEDGIDAALLAVAVLGIAGCAVIFLFVVRPGNLGLIIAQGGNYTEYDLRVYRTPSLWAFAYGNLSQDGLKNMTLAGGDMTESDAYSEMAGDDADLWLFASPAPYINVSDLVSGNPSDVDSFLGLDASDPMSGTNVFNYSQEFLIGNMSYLAWTMRSNSVYGNYTVALFNASFNGSSYLVFAIRRVEGGIGFDSKRHDFQIMLPVAGNMTYYFSSWTNMSSDVNCSQQLNLAAVRSDSTVTLMWDAVEGADHYSVLYMTDPTDPLNASEYALNFSAAQSRETTATNYTLNITSPNIYYNVRPASGSVECSNEEYAAYMEIPLYSIAGNRYNFVSTPLDLYDSNITRVLDPIHDEFVQAYWYDNSLKVYRDYSFFCFGASCFPIDNIGNFVPHEAYWIEVSSNTTLPLAGRLVDRTDVALTPDYNSVGFHLIQGDRSPSAVFPQIYGNMTTVYEYDNLRKIYRQFSLFCFGASCFPTGDLSSIEPARAYWVGVTADERLEWPKD